MLTYSYSFVLVSMPSDVEYPNMLTLLIPHMLARTLSMPPTLLLPVAAALCSH